MANGEARIQAEAERDIAKRALEMLARKLVVAERSAKRWKDAARHFWSAKRAEAGEHLRDLESIERERDRLSERLDTPTYSLHKRRLLFMNHPDADAGQYVLAAVFGEGNGIWGGAHELCLCMDDEARDRLVETLNSGPLGGC